MNCCCQATTLAEFIMLVASVLLLPAVTLVVTWAIDRRFLWLNTWRVELPRFFESEALSVVVSLSSPIAKEEEDKDTMPAASRSIAVEEEELPRFVSLLVALLVLVVLWREGKGVVVGRASQEVL
jgi:hypothetical protein